MSKTAVGMLAGGVLGLLDGLSAWMYPEARPMMTVIMLGSTLKGIATGAAAGFAARRWRSAMLAVAVGVVVGFALSTLAARGQPGHYWEIVLPGMLVGALAGFVAERYPRPVRMMAIMVLLAHATLAAAQSSPTVDPLLPLDFLLGRWEGTSDGQPGTGTVQREYTRILRSRYIEARNRSVYAPQPKNPKGETHEDIGVFSFDRARKRFVLRQFHVEGFVNQYVAEIPAKGAVVFSSESIENLPAGWRARETYTRISDDEIEEVFELAEPGKEFALYSKSRLKRVR
jgi:hypothetical protein